VDLALAEEEGAVRKDTGVASDAEWLNLRHRLTSNVASPEILWKGEKSAYLRLQMPAMW
jgi:hypothetical protein